MPFSLIAAGEDNAPAAPATSSLSLDREKPSQPKADRTNPARFFTRLKTLATSQFQRVSAFGLAHLESCTILD
jgi:hypothetical protein